MITRLRNKALKRLGISFSLLVLALVCVGLRGVGVPAALAAVAAIVSVTFAFVFYIQGNVALAEAKGYDGAVVGAIIIVASLCLGGLFFAMPLILFFGLTDKNRRERRYHSDVPESAKQNPLAKLPPLKNDHITPPNQ